MQVKTTSASEVALADLARGLVAAGPEAFGEFMLEFYREVTKSKSFNLDKAAAVMAEAHGCGRFEVFDKLMGLVAYHQERERREHVATNDD